jgi:hypothetical protein
MKKTSDSIHRLITGMSKKERNYFSRFVFNDKRKGENKLLLQLFNAIAKMKVYDEPKLLKTLSDRLTAGSFKTLKSELKKIILSSLEAQGSRATPTMQWRKKMNRTELLRGSGLYKEALLLVHELEKYDITLDDDYNWLHHLEAVKTEKHILQQDGQLSLLQLEALEKSTKSSLDIFWLDRTAETLTLILTNISSHNLLMNQALDEQNFKKAYQKFTTFLSNNKGVYYYYKYRGHIAASLITADFKNYSTQCLTMWKNFNHPQHIYKPYLQRFPHCYADMFITTVHACILTKNIPTLETILPEAKAGMDTYFFDNEYIRSYRHHAHLMLAHLQNNTLQMQHYAAIIEKHLLPENDLARYRYFSTSLALVYHRLGNYKAALRHCHRVLATNLHERSEIHYRHFCDIFQFIVLYDMQPAASKNNLQSDSLLQATLHKLKREHGTTGDKINHAYELCILDYLSEPSPATRNHCLAELNLLRNTATARHFNALFDFEQWVESR